MSCARRLRPAVLRFLLIGSMACLTACGGQEAAAEEKHGTPQPATGEKWAKIEISGRPAGHVYTRTRELKHPDHGLLVETHVFTRISILRLGSEVRIEMTETTRERAENGRLVSLSAEQKMARQATLREFEFRDGRAHMTTTVMGKSRQSSMRCPPEAVGPHWIEKRTQELGFEVGASFDELLFHPDMGGAKMTTTTVLPRDGDRYVVETKFHGLPYKPTNWYDGAGKLLRTRIAIGGLQLDMIPCSREEALKQRTAELPPDVFKDTLVVAPHGIAAPRHVERAILRVRAREEMPQLGHRDFQTVETTAAGETLVTIRKVVPPAPQERDAKESPAELKASLAPNSMIQSDAPEIAAIAKEVAGGIGDPWKAAQALEAWVYKNVSKKSLDVGLATALEVCKDREGDCTEHAVLLAALCRARGIPARVCMGLEYISGVWGGHAWNEVWIAGSWYPLDATNGYGFADALHLTLASMTLADSNFGAEFAKLAVALGNLKIEIVEAARAGRTIRPAEVEKGTDGDTYRHTDWGVRFQKPHGMSFQTPARKMILSSDLVEIRGGDVRIRVSARDAAPSFTWKRLGKGTALEVAGKPARRIEDERGLRVFVRSGLGLFRFGLKGKPTPEGRKALDAVLASVRFE